MGEQTKLDKLKDEYATLNKELKGVTKEVEAHPDDNELRAKQIALLQLCNSRLAEMIELTK
jgi:hypothetical protein